MDVLYLHSDRGLWVPRPCETHRGTHKPPGKGLGVTRDVKDTEDTPGTKRSCYSDHRHRHPHRILSIN